MGLCNPKTARKSPTVLLDPYSNNKTIISGGGSKFKADTDCYWELFQNPQITAGNKYYKYQIELNLTQMAGVLLLLPPSGRTSILLPADRPPARLPNI